MRLLFLALALLAIMPVSQGAEDILIADFEANNYGEWQITGEAFGTAPARGAWPNQQPVRGFVGKGLVNTYGNGDKPTGTITSPAFQIQRPLINFLCGGGRDPEKLAVQLLVDGKIVRQATGRNDEALEWETWNVRDLAGKQAQIQIIDQATGRWGHINVDQIVQSDRKASSLIDRYQQEIWIQKRYLNLPVKNGADTRRMSLSVDGRKVRAFEIELAEGEPDFWVFIDVGDWKGKQARLEVDRVPENSRGMKAISQEDWIRGDENLYQEKLRPQFHFTQKRGWNNDPNGMVYYQGEWHLFFQHNPYGWKWNNMHWGHAVSKDLLHWEELPIALYPWTMAKGHCFSGSAAVDENNTSGFQTGREKVLVAAFTDTASGEAIAFSNDRGRTWTCWEGNPVVRHGGRDPRIFWFAPGRHWVMAVYDTAGGNNIAIYNSPDLKNWSLQSRVPGYFECPELFELPVDGDAQNTRWVLYAADAKYAIGRFDGKTFTPEHAGKYQVHAGAYYASQTFNNAPGNRRIQIGWGKIDMPQMPFNQMMTFPCELTLRTTPEGLRLFARPIREIAQLHREKHLRQNLVLEPDQPVALEVKNRLLDIRAEFEVGRVKAFGLRIFGVPITYDAAGQLLEGISLKPVNGKIHLQVLVDRSSREICGNDGRIYLTSAFKGEETNQAVEAWSLGGATRLSRLEAFELKSIWAP